MSSDLSAAVAMYWLASVVTLVVCTLGITTAIDRLIRSVDKVAQNIDRLILQRRYGGKE